MTQAVSKAKLEHFRDLSDTTLSQRSLANLKGVHPFLERLAHIVHKTSKHKFVITYGVRTVKEQAALVARGVSWTMNSKHLKQLDGYAHAIDFAIIVDGKLSNNLTLYEIVYKEFERAAKEQPDAKILQWGGYWTVRDGMHIELVG